MTVKLSISVPDELWDQAMAKSLGGPPSRLVQNALRHWVKDEGTASQPYVRDSNITTEPRFVSIRERFVAEATEEFDRGYESAIEAAEHLTWSDIECLSSMGFSVIRWAGVYGELTLQIAEGRLPKHAGVPSREAVSALAKGLGSYVSHPDFFERSRPGPVFIDGYTKAFRDLWASVTAPVSVPPTATEDAETGD